MHFLKFEKLINEKTDEVLLCKIYSSKILEKKKEINY